MENGMRLWEYNWYRVGNIMQEHHEEQPLQSEEIQILGDCQSFCKPDRWEATEQRIRTQEPPRTNGEYREIAYPSFGELAKLLPRYENITQKNIYTKHHNPNIPPTRGVQCNGKTQLIKHRENSNQCQVD